ncbi:alpha/beta hydrolase [Streptomyces sp. NPDC057137]|uniref:alpha/beta hydrolase n=1 Tax=Streptomyces sp. NPDC057137 TaxID=3346030 RepID=UPI0036446345
MKVPTKYAIDPELAAVEQFPEIDSSDIVAVRAQIAQMMAQVPAPDTTGLTVTDRTIPGPQGASDVLVRIYVPDVAAAPVGILDVHGGGFILGDLDSSHADNIAIARGVGAVVVSVDYRLAPENPFPAGLDDCYAALAWFSDHAAEFGVDPQRIAIHGGSAGGGLCAALALLARDRRGPSIAFQYLGIPELDDRLDTGSMTTFGDTPTWNRPAAVRSWDAYLGKGRRGTHDISPYAAPARAGDLSGLPPAYISAKEFDPLRDEGIAYATALLAAGIPVELHLFPGTFHGSAAITDAAVSQREATERIAVLRKALGA